MANGFGKNKTVCVLWTLLVMYMSILAVLDFVIVIRSWNKCIINKNIGRWPTGLIVCMLFFDAFTSGTKFRRESYRQIHLIAIAVGYLGSFAWNIVGTIWFAKIYGVVDLRDPNLPNYCDLTTYLYVLGRLIISWASLLIGSIGVLFFLVKTRCRPVKMIEFLTEYF